MTCSLRPDIDARVQARDLQEAAPVLEGLLKPEMNSSGLGFGSRICYGSAEAPPRSLSPQPMMTPFSGTSPAAGASIPRRTAVSPQRTSSEYLQAQNGVFLKMSQAPLEAPRSPGMRKHFSQLLEAPMSVPLADAWAAGSSQGPFDSMRRGEPREVTVVEKVIEQQGISAYEVQMVLQGERARVSAAIQDIISEQSQTFTQLLKDEVRKITTMVNSSTLSITERVAQLESERASRSAVLQAVGRDVDSLQAQLAALDQFRLKMSQSLEQTSREREEVMGLLDSVTKDIRNQHGVVLSSLASQKEQQQKADLVLASIRSDLEAVIIDTTSIKTSTLQSAQQDLQAAQKDQQQKMEHAVSDLRRQTQQSLDGLRAEVNNDMQMLKQMNIGSLAERVRVLEANHFEQDIKDLARAVQVEKTARAELVQNFETLQSNHVQRCGELRSEINTLPDQMNRIARAVAEELSVRDRLVDLETVIADMRSVISRQGDGAQAQTQAMRSLEKDLQDVAQSVKETHSVQSEFAQMFESDRHMQNRTATELRADIQLLRDKLVETSKAPAEDRYARDCCLKVEQALVDIRSVTQTKVAELRAEILEAPKETDEIKRLLQAECEARRDLAQAVDAYRMSHLQTSSDLRGDLDRALEKFDRVETVLERANRSGSITAFPSSPSRRTAPEAAQLERILERLAVLESGAPPRSELPSTNTDILVESRATGLGTFSTPLRTGASGLLLGNTSASAAQAVPSSSILAGTAAN